jgi:ComF family protein
MKKIFNLLLDFLLPRSKNLKMIEEMNADIFRQSVSQIIQNPGHETVAIFSYRHPLVKTAVWELKYRGNRKITGLLAECLYEELIPELTERKMAENFENPLLVPIPISDSKRLKRGFNQCELLAKALEKMDNGRFFETDFSALKKIEETESQTGKNRTARLANLKNSFVASPEKVSGRNIILIDDVTTTGATFEEARKTLLRSGARKIFCAAIGH